MRRRLGSRWWTAVITIFVIFSPAVASAASQAEVMAAMYGTIIGHADQCGYSIQSWHAQKMGERIASLAVDRSDEDRAVAMFRRTSEIVQQSPTMSCEDARAVHSASEQELM